MKHAYWQLYRLLHPYAMVSLHLGTQTISEDTLLNVQAFFILYDQFYACNALADPIGVDMTTSISAVVSALSNVGPGLERVGPFDDYAWLPASAKWLLATCILLGRLEFSALLVLCMPSFWKQ